MRKVFSLGSFIAAIAVIAMLSLSFTGPTFAQGGTETATPTTTGTDTAATTTTDTAATTTTDTAATTTTDTAATTTTGTGADTSATTTTGSATGSSPSSPSTLPNTAEGDLNPVAPPIVFVLLLALIAGAVGFFALAARRNAER